MREYPGIRQPEYVAVRGRNEPIKLGMNRKMFSYGWSLAALAGFTAVPLALPFARLRTADIMGRCVRLANVD